MPKAKPDPAVVQQVTEQAQAQIQAQSAAPEGTFAAPADVIKKFGPMIPKLAKPLLEIAMLMAGGPLSPSKITRIAGIVADAVNEAMKSGTDPQV